MSMFMFIPTRFVVVLEIFLFILYKGWQSFILARRDYLPSLEFYKRPFIWLSFGRRFGIWKCEKVPRRRSRIAPTEINSHLWASFMHQLLPFLDSSSSHLVTFCHRNMPLRLVSDSYGFKHEFIVGWYFFVFGRANRSVEKSVAREHCGFNFCLYILCRMGSVFSPVFQGGSQALVGKYKNFRFSVSASQSYPVLVFT